MSPTHCRVKQQGNSLNYMTALWENGPSLQMGKEWEEVSHRSVPFESGPGCAGLLAEKAFLLQRSVSFTRCPLLVSEQQDCVANPG